MLTLEDVTFSHPGAAPVYRFTMVAKPGEITAITGASGAGKSTLLDLIAGFAVPTGGTIGLDGTDLRARPPERRPVSILFQSETLFEHLSAGANLALGLPKRTKKAEADAAIAQALAEVGLPQVRRQRANTLSGGQKQRVALARTLLRNQPILLLDEPFSALDDQTRRAIRNLVRRFTTERRWHTVLVSHQREDVAELADITYDLRAGQLWG